MSLIISDSEVFPNAQGHAISSLSDPWNEGVSVEAHAPDDKKWGGDAFENAFKFLIPLILTILIFMLSQAQPVVSKSACDIEVTQANSFAN